MLHGHYFSVIVKCAILHYLNVLPQLPAAIDEDTGTNNSLNDYLMLTSNTPFTLQSRNAFSDDWTLKLTLLRRLDREVIPSYRLLIAAVDGGVPVRSGTLTVLTQVGGMSLEM